MHVEFVRRWYHTPALLSAKHAVDQKSDRTVRLCKERKEKVVVAVR